MAHQLPFLPGNTRSDPTKTDFRVCQTLKYKNGYRVPLPRPKMGVGGAPITPSGLTQEELDVLANYSPTLTYGMAKQDQPSAFIPAHVALDKKVLRFYGYFKETVNESQVEHYRVRPIVLYYYLEDDSITIVEPPKENSGMQQGTIVRRQQLPKNEVGDHYTWKDLNLGIVLCAYGRVYRLIDCDGFTKTYLESEGIEVGPKEEMPDDPYLAKRTVNTSLRTFKTASSFDQRRQFMEMDRKVLRFYAVWDDTDSMFGEQRFIVIHYFLVNDTLEVRENHQPNDGRDPFPVLIRRDKIPKNRYNVAPTFPSIALELTSEEVRDYFSPRDFKIGTPVTILGRRFIPYDCDNFTKAWYHKHFGIVDFTPMKVEGAPNSQFQEAAEAQMEIGPYTGVGSYEDSMASSFSVQPRPPKVDYVKQVELGTTVLRYEAILDSIRPEDRGRRFIVSYRLADDKVNIFEPPIRNSGVVGGTFLSRSRVTKPESTPERPLYYGPQDFYICAKFEAFGNRFIITNADKFVLTYLEAHPDQVPPAVIQSLRERMARQAEAEAQQEHWQASVKLRRQDGDLLQMVQSIRSQLMKLSITDKARMDAMFLRYNKGRQGAITLENLQDMCWKMQLPADLDVLGVIMSECGTDGKMDLEQFRKFFES